jgi:integrase
MTIQDRAQRMLDELGMTYQKLDSIHAKPTFFGVLEKYFFETDEKGRNVGISRGWEAEDTFLTYIERYRRNILPIFPNPDMALEDYSSEDLLAPIDELAGKKHLKSGEFSHYSQSTINNHKHLIKRVYEKALEKGIVNASVINGTSLSYSDLNPQDLKDEKKKIKKSFTPIQEIAFMKRLICGIRKNLLSAKGEDIGLLMMALLGLRNHEVAGLNFRDVLPYQSSPDQQRIVIYKTSVRNTAALKGGGKTSNAVRSLPFFKGLYSILIDRKNSIEKYYKDLGLEVDVDALPIACRGTDYQRRCSAGNIGNAGRDHLLALFYPQRRLAAMEEVLRNEATQGDPKLFILGLEEKDPTTYSLRRNAVTRMHQCGLTESEIQFFTGHKIEDNYGTRGDFVDEDMLREIVRKLERHPIFQLLEEGSITHSYPPPEVMYIDDKDLCTLNINDTSSCAIEVAPSTEDRILTIFIEEKEPFDSAKVEIENLGSKETIDLNSSPNSLDVSIVEIPYKPNHNRTVNIIKKLWEVYYNAYQEYQTSNKSSLFSEE